MRLLAFWLVFGCGSASPPKPPTPPPAACLSSGPSEQLFLCDPKGLCTAGNENEHARADPDRRGAVRCDDCVAATTAYCFNIDSDGAKQHQWHSVCATSQELCADWQAHHEAGRRVVCGCAFATGGDYIPNE